jgi:hypothetical protein
VWELVTPRTADRLELGFGGDLVIEVGGLDDWFAISGTDYRVASDIHGTVPSDLGSRTKPAVI